MTISAIVLAITGVSGEGGGTGGSPPKDEGVLKNGWTGWQMHSKDLQERLLRHCLLLWEVLLVQF